MFDHNFQTVTSYDGYLKKSTKYKSKHRDYNNQDNTSQCKSVYNNFSSQKFRHVYHKIVSDTCKDECQFLSWLGHLFDKH